MGSRLSILSNARKSDLRLDPYPHFVIENALDADLYASLDAALPPDDIVVDGRPVKDTWYDYPACRVVQDERIAALWREFFAYHVSAEFYRELIGLTGDAIRDLYPTLETKLGKALDALKVGMRPGGKGDPLAPGADVSMECQFYANFTRKPREVRGPHVDRPSELFAALLYLRRPNDDSTGSDLEVCRARSEKLYPGRDKVRISTLPAEIDHAEVSTVHTAKYAANTLVLFINSPRSIHAVTPRSPTQVTRRHINFCCDLNFDLFEMQLSPRLKLRKTLEQMPIAWRAARWV